MTGDRREESQEIADGNADQENGSGEGEPDTSDSQAATSSNKRVYDPENCKKVRKLSSAQMQEKEIKMREDRQTAFINTMKSIQNNNDPASNALEQDDGDSDFTKFIGKQMRLVLCS